MSAEEGVCTYMHVHKHNSDKQNTLKHPATLFKSSIFLGRGGSKLEILSVQRLGLTLWKNASD